MAESLLHVFIGHTSGHRSEYEYIVVNSQKLRGVDALSLPDVSFQRHSYPGQPRNARIEGASRNLFTT